METKLRLIPKQVSKAFGKKIYLLGIDKEGYGVYLEEPKWDCGWYWGFGYIERYTNKMHPERAKDIQSHSHWSGGVVGEHDYYDPKSDSWKKTQYNHHLNDNPFMKATVLTDQESWKLAELMATFYNLSEAAKLFEKGASNISNLEEEREIIKRDAWAKEINEKILPEIFKLIDNLLSPKQEGDK